MEIKRERCVVVVAFATPVIRTKADKRHGCVTQANGHRRGVALPLIFVEQRDIVANVMLVNNFPAELRVGR